MKVGIIGGGAAGYFAAMRHKELFPAHEVCIFEKTSKVLGKVKVSGGGRCNVTHACFNPNELIKYYPRGGKELLGPFHRFQPADTIVWFSQQQVTLKTEDDGRVFPVTDRSETIIELFQKRINDLGIVVKLKHNLVNLATTGPAFNLFFENEPSVKVDQIIITTGSSEAVWQILQKLGHSIVPPVPSLFTFNIEDDRLKNFPGSSWSNVGIRIVDTKYYTGGPMLITHWGLSGPAILKLSAVAAIDLYAKLYNFDIQVNFMHPNTMEQTLQYLKTIKQSNLNKLVNNTSIDGFSAKVWSGWVELLGLATKRWQEVSNKDIVAMSLWLNAATFHVRGKSTFKEEFVTAGGIELQEVNMKTMESKKNKNLYFAGELLNIDALTGGFNFQAAWTTGWLAGSNGEVNKK